MHPSKEIAKNHVVLLQFTLDFDIWTYPENWNLLSSKIVHSPIKCDWMFFSSTVAAVNNGKAALCNLFIREVFKHASVYEMFSLQYLAFGDNIYIALN